MTNSYFFFEKNCNNSSNLSLKNSFSMYFFAVPNQVGLIIDKLFFKKVR